MKWLCRIGILSCCGLMSGAGAHAMSANVRDTSDVATESLIRARTVDEVLNIVLSAEQLDEVRGICQAQLGGGLVPVTCFQVVSLEFKAGLLNSFRAAEMRSLLEETCREKVANVVSSADMERALSLLRGYRPSTGEGCVAAIRERLAELRYIRAAETRSSLFLRRLESE